MFSLKCLFACVSLADTKSIESIVCNVSIVSIIVYNVYNMSKKNIIVKLLTLSSQSNKDLHYSGRNFITRFAGKTQLILCIYRLKGTSTVMFKNLEYL